MDLTISILGCGTSTGVPIIGCDCAVCTGDNPRNMRLRSSILLRNNTTNKKYVIDTTPDFRIQMLREKVKDLDAVFYTHTHADHCHGFDDLRAFFFTGRMLPINCYLPKHFMHEFKERFSYAFMHTGYTGYTPNVEMIGIDEGNFVTECGLEVEAIKLPHGNVETFGYRFGRFAYLTDFKKVPAEIIERWRGNIDTMVASGLRFRDHNTHSTISETCALIKELGVRQAYLTHMSHEIDIEKDAAKLAPNISFAFDGLQIHVKTD